MAERRDRRQLAGTLTDRPPARSDRLNWQSAGAAGQLGLQVDAAPGDPAAGLHQQLGRTHQDSATWRLPGGLLRRVRLRLGRVAMPG